jgi:AcrR family transcriptional regulator
VEVSFYLMSETTRPRRAYDGARRRQQAQETRARVVAAAARVFLEHGYTGATIPLIATEAGVALQTVYRAAPSKADLLQAAVLAAVAGGSDRSAVPVEERPAIRAVIDEPDPRRQLALYAQTQPGIWSRVGALMRVLDAAATSEPTLAQFRDAQDQQRLDGLSRFAALMGERGVLKEGLSPHRAADVIWTVCSRATYDSLVLARGWSHEEYEQWLAETLQAALLR